MASIVVCGGSVIGLSAAVMLARDGHRVTVLEADSESPPAAPAAAWERWRRQGVAQFRQSHNVFPRFRQVCDQELTELPGRLAAAGCRWVDPLGAPAVGGMLPPSLSDHEPRPGDEAFRHVAARRPVVESVIATVAAGQPGLTIRRGVRVTGLTGGPSAIPGVFGLITGLPAGTARIPWDGPQVRSIEHQAHAPGHAALLIEERGVLVAGDMLSDALIPMLDLNDTADPIEDYLAALRLLEGAAGDVDVLVPGHGSVGGADQVHARID